MTKRQRIARECLRQIWQIFDLAGHSMGRSQEAVLLEAAMRLLGPDSSFSDLADEQFTEFMRVVGDELYRVSRAELRAQDEETHEPVERRGPEEH